LNQCTAIHATACPSRLLAQVEPQILFCRSRIVYLPFLFWWHSKTASNRLFKSKT